MTIIKKTCLLIICFASLPITILAGGANAPFESWGLPILKQSPSTTEILLSNFNIKDKGVIQSEPEDKARIAEHGRAHFRVKYFASSKTNPEHRFVLYLYTKGHDVEYTAIFKSIELVPIE